MILVNKDDTRKELEWKGNPDTGAGLMEVTGSSIDLRGLAANRPAANAVAVGVTYWAVDTGVVTVSDGTNWVVV